MGWTQIWIMFFAHWALVGSFPTYTVSFISFQCTVQGRALLGFFLGDVSNFHFGSLITDQPGSPSPASHILFLIASVKNAAILVCTQQTSWSFINSTLSTINYDCTSFTRASDLISGNLYGLAFVFFNTLPLIVTDLLFGKTARSLPAPHLETTISPRSPDPVSGESYRNQNLWENHNSCRVSPTGHFGKCTEKQTEKPA